MTPRRLLEIKVGAFIVSGIALLVFFIFVIGDFSSYFEQRYQLRVRFDSANGVATGSPVKFAGIEKGRVDRVELISDAAGLPQVEIIVSLPNEIQIHGDDIARISTLGLLGEMYLGIMPGPRSEPIIPPGGVLVGRTPVSTEDLLEDSNEVLTELKQTLGGINTMVGDENARTYLREALQDARDATRNWKVLGERLNMSMYHIEAGEGNIGKMIYDESLYENAMGFVNELKAHPWKLLSRPKEEKKKK